MTQKLKEEYQPGGSKRQEILDKAVEYLKEPRFGLQADRIIREYESKRSN
jgi:hypothetical protein